MSSRRNNAKYPFTDFSIPQEERAATALINAVRITMATLRPSIPRKYSMWIRPNQATLLTSIHDALSMNCIPASELMPAIPRSNLMKMAIERTSWTRVTTSDVHRMALRCSFGMRRTRTMPRTGRKVIQVSMPNPMSCIEEIPC